jgi:hypothetical protein
MSINNIRELLQILQEAEEKVAQGDELTFDKAVSISRILNDSFIMTDKQ